MQTAIRTTGELGPLLRRLRKARNWSQSELGERIGLSQERVSAIENKPESVTFDNLLTLMMALDVHFSVVEREPGEPASRSGAGAQRNEVW